MLRDRAVQQSGRGNRQQIEAFVGRKMTDAEWGDVCELLELIEAHADAEDAFDRCMERGLSVAETIQELSKLPAGSSRKNEG